MFDYRPLNIAQVVAEKLLTHSMEILNSKEVQKTPMKLSEMKDIHSSTFRPLWLRMAKSDGWKK